MQKWEYLTVQKNAPEIVNTIQTAPQFINSHEIRDSKKVHLHAFLIQPGVYC